MWHYDGETYLASISITSLKEQLADVQEKLEFAEEMQENLNLHLGVIPTLADILDEWLVKDYYELRVEDISIAKMIREAEFKLGYRVDVDTIMSIHDFMAKLHSMFSGKHYENGTYPLLPIAYLPFLVNYIKYNLPQIK